MSFLKLTVAGKLQLLAPAAPTLLAPAVDAEPAAAAAAAAPPAPPALAPPDDVAPGTPEAPATETAPAAASVPPLPLAPAFPAALEAPPAEVLTLPAVLTTLAELPATLDEPAAVSDRSPALGSAPHALQSAAPNMSAIETGRGVWTMLISRGSQSVSLGCDFGVAEDHHVVLIVAVGGFFDCKQVGVGDAHTSRIFQWVNLGAVGVGG